MGLSIIILFVEYMYAKFCKRKRRNHNKRIEYEYKIIRTIDVKKQQAVTLLKEISNLKKVLNQDNASIMKDMSELF